LFIFEKQIEKCKAVESPSNLTGPEKDPGIQRCLSDSGIYCPRGKDLDLDGNACWIFWIPISFKIQAGVFLGFATSEKNTYRSIFMIGHRRFAVVKFNVDFMHALVPLTACTVSHH